MYNEPHVLITPLQKVSSDGQSYFTYNPIHFTNSVLFKKVCLF